MYRQKLFRAPRQFFELKANGKNSFVRFHHLNWILIRFSTIFYVKISYAIRSRVVSDSLVCVFRSRYPLVNALVLLIRFYLPVKSFQGVVKNIFVRDRRLHNKVWRWIRDFSFQVPPFRMTAVWINFEVSILISLSWVVFK